MGLIKAAAPAPLDAAPPELSSPDPSERRRAALLANAPDAVEALAAALAQEDDPAAREAMLVALARIGTPSAIEILARLLGADDPALRNGALASLAGVPATARACLDGLAVSSDPDVRIFGLLLAAELPFEDMPAWVADQLAIQCDANVCAAAIEVLIQIGDAADATAVREAADRFPDEPFLAHLADHFAETVGGGVRP